MYDNLQHQTSVNIAVILYVGVLYDFQYTALVFVHSINSNENSVFYEIITDS